MTTIMSQLYFWIKTLVSKTTSDLCFQIHFDDHLKLVDFERRKLASKWGNINEYIWTCCFVRLIFFQKRTYTFTHSYLLHSQFFKNGQIFIKFDVRKVKYDFRVVRSHFPQVRSHFPQVRFDFQEVRFDFREVKKAYQIQKILKKNVFLKTTHKIHFFCRA